MRCRSNRRRVPVDNIVPDALMPALFSEIATRAPFVRERAIADSIHMTRREREIVTLISQG